MRAKRLERKKQTNEHLSSRKEVFNRAEVSGSSSLISWGLSAKSCGLCGGIGPPVGMDKELFSRGRAIINCRTVLRDLIKVTAVGSILVIEGSCIRGSVR